MIISFPINALCGFHQVKSYLQVCADNEGPDQDMRLQSDHSLCNLLTESLSIVQ